MSISNKNIDEFDKEYREQCFYSWYSAGCPVNMRQAVPENSNGKKPTGTTLKRWARDDGWRARADAMDAELSIKIDTEIIERKKQDYLEMSNAGREMMKKALDYLKTDGFDTASAAVRAVIGGADMMAKYSRAVEMIDAVLGKTDAQIQKEIYRLLGKTTADDEVIDGNSDTEEDDNSE